jgi:hypothetical protein
MTGDERAATLREGTKLYNAGRAKEAARLLRTISFPPEERQSPTYLAWCCNLASALAETGELSGATKLFEEAAGIHEERHEWRDLALVRFNLGNVSRYAGALDQAQIQYEGARAAHEKAGDLAGIVMVLQSLGNLALLQGDPAAARNRLNQIAALAPDDTPLDPLTRWSLATLRGSVALREGDGTRAVESLTQAVEQAEQLEDRSYLPGAHTTLGQALLETGQPTDALVHLEKATELWEGLRNPKARQVARLRDAVRAMVGSSAPPRQAEPPEHLPPEDPPGNVLPLDGPPPGPQASIMAAESMTDVKLAAVMKSVESQGGGGIVVRVAEDVVFGAMQDWDEWSLVEGDHASMRDLEGRVAATPAAAAVFLQAARMAATKGVRARVEGAFEGSFAATAFALRAAIAGRDTRGINTISSNLLMLESDLSSMLTRPLSTAAPRDEQANERYRAVLSHMRELAGELIPALEQLLEAAAMLENPSARLRLLLSLRRILAAGQKLAPFEQKLLPAWAGGGVIGERAGATARHRRQVLSELIDVAAAIDHRDEALTAVYEELTLVRLSEILSAVGRPTAVTEQVARLVAAGPEDSVDSGAFDALWTLYLGKRGWIGQVNDRKVLAACALAVEHFEKLRILAVYAGTASGHIASYDVTQLQTKINRDFVVLLHSGGFTTQALDQAERTIGRAMVDWMARTHLTDRAVVREGFSGSVGEVEVAGLGEIVQLAAASECLAVYYLSTATGWMAWLVGTGGILQFERLEGIEALVAELDEHLPYRADPSRLLRAGEPSRGAPLGKAPKASADALLQRLGDALFPETFRAAIAKAHSARLAIITDGVLHYVPFACLRPGGSRYLVEEFELVYWPSATSVLLCESELHARAASTQLPSVVIGDPLLRNPYPVGAEPGAPAIAFPPLPGTRTEAEFASRALGVDARLDTDATMQGVLDHFYGRDERQWRPYAPVIHIAAHGLLNAERPEDSFVALADGPLRASFLYRFDRGIRAGLVVLSCCQTGLGAIHPDSVIGLANSFLVTGACAVLSTLWQVPDASTDELIQLLYGRLTAGEPVAAALTQAQREMLGRTQRKHPLHWGAFKVAGANVRIPVAVRAE